MHLTPLEELPRVIDGFLVLELDPWKLKPRALFKLPVSKAKRVWSTDRYQGSGKLTFDERFKDLAEAV